MRFNRSRDDIISDILEVASGGGIATKMGIMYKTFLSHAQMKNYLTYLTQHDLIEYDTGAQIYKTTEKGLMFLDTYGQMDDMIKDRPLPTTTTTSVSYPQEEEEVQQEQVS
ncbi:MAG: winged helix-turn-helix domain-containing protein [Nitrososphaera sp.]